MTPMWLGPIGGMANPFTIKCLGKWLVVFPQGQSRETGSKMKQEARTGHIHNPKATQYDQGFPYSVMPGKGPSKTSPKDSTSHCIEYS